MTAETRANDKKKVREHYDRMSPYYRSLWGEQHLPVAEVWGGGDGNHHFASASGNGEQRGGEGRRQREVSADGRGGDDV